jgi:hypothetical protein
MNSTIISFLSDESGNANFLIIPFEIKVNN